MQKTLQGNKLVSSLTARTQFGQIKNRITKNSERYFVSDRGNVSVVVLGIEDFLRNVVKQPNIMKELQEEARKSGSNKLTMKDINAEIAAYRREQK